MNKTVRLAGIVLVIAALAALGWRLTHRQPASPEGDAAENAGGEKKEQPVVHVQMAKVERKTISQEAISYGSVIAPPGKVHSVSVAFETRVRHILVAPGEFVHEGEPLVEIELSPAAQLQLQQVKNTEESAKKELDQTQVRYNLKLATNQDLGAAQKAAKDAELQLESLQKQGAGADNHIHADMTGLVGKVDVQDGQIATAGTALVELVAGDEIEVKLGVEPGDMSFLQPGEPIALFPVNEPNIGKINGAVRLLTHRVDPATRLVDVYVSLPKGTKLLLDGYVRGEITRTSEKALIVPRSALLPAEGGYSLFTVEKGRALRHIVKTGLENDLATEVITPDLHEGDQVVTEGNYELEEGMSADVQETK